MKKKVKFLDSIAGLADPDREKLDKRYETMRAQAKAKAEEAGREFKPAGIEAQIKELKKSDRYDDVQRGFKKDFGYKPGEEAMIPAAVALAWEEAGICVILEEQKKAA